MCERWRCIVRVGRAGRVSYVLRMLRVLRRWNIICHLDLDDRRW